MSLTCSRSFPRGVASGGSHLFIFIITKIECWPVFKQDPNPSMDVKLAKLTKISKISMSYYVVFAGHFHLMNTQIL